MLYFPHPNHPPGLLRSNYKIDYQRTGEPLTLDLPWIKVKPQSCEYIPQKPIAFFLFRLSRSSIPQKKPKKQLQHKSMYAIIYFNGSSCANVLFVLIQISNCKLIWKRFNISIKLFIINHKV